MIAKKATGGYIDAIKPYIVGEAGYEIYSHEDEKRSWMDNVIRPALKVVIQRLGLDKTKLEYGEYLDIVEVKDGKDDDQHKRSELAWIRGTGPRISTNKGRKEVVELLPRNHGEVEGSEDR